MDLFKQYKQSAMVFQAMTKFRRIHFLRSRKAAAAFAASIAWAVTNMPAQGLSNHPTYQDLVKKDSEPELARVDKVKLWNSEGKAFSLAHLNGKLVLLDFFFTSCPTICPLQTAGLAKTWDKLGADAQRSIIFVSVSIDPEHDTKEKLVEYRRRFGIKTASWIFASGKKESVEGLAKSFGSLSGNLGPREHKARIYLLDRQGAFLLSFSSAPTIDSDKVAQELKRAVLALNKSPEG
jgi:protein SCO1/2